VNSNHISFASRKTHTLAHIWVGGFMIMTQTGNCVLGIIRVESKVSRQRVLTSFIKFGNPNPFPFSPLHCLLCLLPACMLSLIMRLKKYVIQFPMHHHFSAQQLSCSGFRRRSSSLCSVAQVMGVWLICDTNHTRR
jgi:hypothetical protein